MCDDEKLRGGVFKFYVEGITIDGVGDRNMIVLLDK